MVNTKYEAYLHENELSANIGGVADNPARFTNELDLQYFAVIGPVFPCCHFVHMLVPGNRYQIKSCR